MSPGSASSRAYSASRRSIRRGHTRDRAEGGPSCRGWRDIPRNPSAYSGGGPALDGGERITPAASSKTALRRRILVPPDGREQEIKESEGCDDRGREERRPEADEVPHDARSERGRRRDHEPHEPRRGVHATEQVLRSQRLDQADGAHDP